MVVAMTNAELIKMFKDSLTLGERVYGTPFEYPMVGSPWLSLFSSVGTLSGGTYFHVPWARLSIRKQHFLLKHFVAATVGKLREPIFVLARLIEMDSEGFQRVRDPIANLWHTEIWGERVELHEILCTEEMAFLQVFYSRSMTRHSETEKLAKVARKETKRQELIELINRNL